MNNGINDLSWVGSERNFVDDPLIMQIQHIVVGRYGGNSNAGQYKNEDGCLVWANEKEDWEFVIILDAHKTAKSAEVVLKQFEKKRIDIRNQLSLELSYDTFNHMEKFILSIFKEEEFLDACRKVEGETACLIVVRKGKYIWWFSIGDCILYLYHPELAALGQFQLNQRQFYEWVGQVNTFDQNVPCYSTGTRELRKGINQLLLTTDGLIECPKEPFAKPKDIFNVFTNSSDVENVKSLLLKIQENNVRDSTTIVSWKVSVSADAMIPSDQ
ncbi:protein phosphatase 2C domain-containing protein [Psychrobacillus sp.]|uniref:protein phosphatase 2C domain-containing protein n=1 Tax=Psychrobacillus sp. TaxID=1871623 RepID=UPI0028BE765E|nr:protein phosphatase 2C domain-containing protein [Psychrobacillus sp.]